MQWSEIRKALQRNAGLRAIALMLAIGLWLFVNAGQRDAQISLQVQVAYRGLPPGLMIVNPHPEFIDLLISGPRTLLSLLDPGRLTLRLDLAGVTPGQADFKIVSELFRLPRQTRIDRVSPAEITLNIDQLVTRELPVHLSIIGRVAKGYAISAIELRPPTVTVTGPRRDVGRLEEIEAEPLDVNDASADLNREVGLISPGGLLKVSATQVEAAVRLQEIVSNREFRGVEVQVRDSDYKFMVEPRQVNVTVRGPVRQLSALNLGAAYVDARGAKPGLYELAVRVDLPQGLELVRQKPEKVKLRIWTKRLKAAG